MQLGSVETPVQSRFMSRRLQKWQQPTRVAMTNLVRQICQAKSGAAGVVQGGVLGGSMWGSGGIFDIASSRGLVRRL